jgi:hypothetical protein
MASDQAKDSSLDRLIVRTYRPENQPVVARLYTDGLLAGQLAPNDTGAAPGSRHRASPRPWR